MLDFLRKGATSWAVKILFLIIIIVFVFWGIGTFRASRVDLLAKVNGEPITVKEYRALYQFRYQQLRQMLGERLNEELLKSLRFREQVLEELIKRRLLEETARQMGIKVSPEEVRLAIAQLPAFQANGAFSFARYQAILRDMGLLPKDFEESVKADLLESRIKHFLTAPVFAPETEVRDRYRYENEVLRVAYVEQPHETCIKEVKVDPKEVQAFYEKNKERYRSPEEVKLLYYLVPYESEKIKVTEEEVRNLYEAEKERFFEPEQRKVRSIFLKAKPGKKKEALAQAEKLKGQIKTLENFETLARKYSNDSKTASLGGDLGFIKRGELFPEAEEALFSASEGELVGPIEHKEGYYLFWVEKIKPAGPKPLKEVREKLEKELRERKAREAAFEKADQLYEKAVLAGGLKEVAAKEGLKLKETSFFSRRNPPVLFSKPEILDSALALEKGEISSPVDVGKGLLLFQVLDKHPSQILPFEKVRARVEKDWKREKAREVCRQKAERLLKEAPRSSLEKFFAHKGFKVVEKTKRRKELLTGHLPQVIGQALAGKAQPGPLPEPVCDQRNCYLVWVKEVQPADFSDWKKERKVLFHILTQQKREAYFRAWYQDLRQKAEIKLYQELS